jgi:hypothetical protein
MADEIDLEMLSDPKDLRGVIFRFHRAGYEPHGIIQAIKRRAIALSETDPEIAQIILLVCSIADDNRFRDTISGAVQISKPFVIK